ncbi:Clavaminate synthase-like protein [Aulographum hederae CBS 113979]|uniref:Clavaminate synthase-like protein n=1 Tax=Aulographum hederae CBS 113979 TaxID=1176131 RepID=A0A6G1GQA9_9PEZI|nr:Clavaminate synthase-like protein [Aulographum hederae CBS 113979]
MTSSPSPSDASSAIEELLSAYHDLNPQSVEELHEEPSPLEFMRFVAQNKPFVLRKGASSWAACRRWNCEYLSEAMRGQSVKVALTPMGNADSVLALPDGAQCFIKPFEKEELFEEALAHIRSQSSDPSYKGPVRYAQTQNDNLRDEYASISPDVPSSVPFARIALQKDPENVNMWIGNSHTTTALHHDPYHNIYAQILGGKHFVLLPPIEAPCINEKTLPAATYRPRNSTAPENAQDLVVQFDDPPDTAPFACWDPDNPSVNTTAFSHLSRPVRVTLAEGDMLYLPALWYHKVSLSCSEEGICCSVNQFYDMDFSGPFWPMSGFVRSIGLSAIGEKQKKEPHNE